MITSKQIIAVKDAVKSASPLVHNITNYVVMNNTANALLSVGASPVMAHAVEEVEEMTGIASALVINMGTLSPRWVKAMLIAGKKANERGIPIIFDPVGVGATPYRTHVAKEIIEACNLAVIRGNASEIMALSNSTIKTKGVDSTMSTDSAKDAAKLLAKETGSIIVISGETDFISNGKSSIILKNGSALMAKVTGMGCTATAVIGACAAVEKDMLLAATSAMTIMGISGEFAAEKSSGNGSMQLNFLDELYNLSSENIESRIRLNYE